MRSSFGTSAFSTRAAVPPVGSLDAQSQPLPPPPQVAYGTLPPPMAPPPPRSMVTERSTVVPAPSMSTGSTVNVTVGEGSAPIPMTKDFALRSVIVRNIPPDADEAELHRLCATVGSVIKFRLVFDRQSGRAKGLGYCEFADSSLAAMAIRKLDKYQYRGRELIVRKPELGGSSGMASKESMERSAAKTAMRSARKTVDEITRAVSKLTAKQKRQVLSEVKALILKNEEHARELLEDRPQLAQALVLIQHELGLIEPTDVQALTVPVRATHQISEEETSLMSGVAPISESEQPPPSLLSAESSDAMVERSLLNPLTSLDPKAKRVLLSCLKSDTLPSEMPANITAMLRQLRGLPPRLKDRVFDILSK